MKVSVQTVGYILIITPVMPRPRCLRPGGTVLIVMEKLMMLVRNCRTGTGYMICTVTLANCAEMIGVRTLIVIVLMGQLALFGKIK